MAYELHNLHTTWHSTTTELLNEVTFSYDFEDFSLRRVTRKDMDSDFIDMKVLLRPAQIVSEVDPVQIWGHSPH
jgi:hypothetical protein